MAKKRPLDSSAETVEVKRANCDLRTESADAASALSEAINSSDLDRVMDELVKLKKFLATKERVLAFLEADRQCFRTFISFVLNQGQEMVSAQRLAETSQKSGRSCALLREAFSLLANACHLSVLACVEVRSKDLSLSRLYVRFLEANHVLVPLPIKAALLRLLGNLCELKETAALIALNRPLMERIALCLELDNQKIVEQTIRILRLLAKRSHLSKSVIRSEACYHLAKYAARHNERWQVFSDRKEVLQVLLSLILYHPSRLGKQLSNCREFSEQCLDFLLEFPFDEAARSKPLAHHWTEFILRSVECSHELRLVLGREAISRVLGLEQNRQQLNDLHCRFLCSFTQDPYQLTFLRESGGLARILDRLDPLEMDGQGEGRCLQLMSQMRLQASIFESFHYVIYDHESLEFTIKHARFMPTALHHIRRYLDLSAPECQVEFDEPEPRVPSALLMDEQLLQESTPSDAVDGVGQQPLPLCKDFSLFQPAFSHSPSASPPSTRRAWSPCLSPSTSGQHSPPSPGTSPPIGSCSPRSDILDEILLGTAADRDGLINKPGKSASPTIRRAAAPGELEPDDPDKIDGHFALFKEDGQEEEEEEGAWTERETELRQKIVRSTLRLISNFSHRDERQSIFLLKPEILDPLVRHVSEAPEMDNQLVRALRRLARNQTGLQLLLEMDFQRMVIRRLIRRPCLLARFARFCVRCDVRRDFGRTLLSDHALLGDSVMGEYILLKLRMDAAQQMADPREAGHARLRALMAALVLIRREERRPRFYHNFRPIEALLEGLARVLRESKESGKALAEDSAEGQLCVDIVATLASLLSHQMLDSSSLLNPRPLAPTKPIPGQDKEKEGQEMRPTNCVLEGPAQGEDTLKFRSKRGQLLAEVPKRELCQWNEYFSGMFGSEFVERLEKRDEFIFDPEAEACTEQEFVKFLHFSIGCPLHCECVRVDSAECCAALLYLADKYLCTRLLDHLLQDGLAAQLVNGQTLSFFLPLVLSVPTIANGLKDTCLLVLLRYSNTPELLATLGHILKCDSGDGRTVDVLRALLHAFIASNTGLGRSTAVGMPWQQFDPIAAANAQYQDF